MLDSFAAGFVLKRIVCSLSSWVGLPKLLQPHWAVHKRMLSAMSTPRKSPSDSCVTVTRMMMPMDANSMGNVFGGTILGLIEETAWLAAIKHARCNLVTASIDRMDFLAPVRIGEMLRLEATVNYVHKTSMEVGVRVESENAFTGEVKHTGTCFLTYVGLGADHKPMLLPLLVAKTDEEIRRWAEAEERHKARLLEMAKSTGSFGKKPPL